MIQTKIVVLGGGVTGLCAAFYLAKAYGSDAVTLVEADDVAGGWAQTDRKDGFQLDQGPNGFLNKEPLMTEWVEDLGLTDHVRQAQDAAGRRFLVKNGQLLEIQPPPKFLLTPMLSIPGRLRLLCEPLIKTKKDSAPETIWDFAARRIGREAADMLVAPMVTGVFGGDAHSLSLAHCFPRMAAMERDHGSLFKALQAKRKENPQASAMGPAGALTAFDEGIGLLCKRAEEELGDGLRTGAAAEKVTKRDGAYRIALAGGEEIEAQGVVVAMPAHRAAPMIADLDVEASKALARIDHCNMVVMCAAYPREKVGHDMAGFGFLVPKAEKRRVLGCLWTSSVFPHQAPEGWVLLRTMVGGAKDPSAVDLTDEELLDYQRKEIHDLMKIDSDPELFQVYRHRTSIPQYGLHHGDVLRALESCEERHPTLAFAGNAYRGVSLNDCIVSARRAVECVGEGLAGCQ